MYTLNPELREFVRTNPYAVVFIISMAANLQDPNTVSIEEYKVLIENTFEQIHAAPPVKRDAFPEGELGETIYRDVRTQYFINARAAIMEHPPLEGETFGEFIACWKTRLLADDTIGKLTKSISPFSIEVEDRFIALASHRVK